MFMFLHVLDARYIRDYAVWLRFSDGTVGEVDLESELKGPLFGPLREIEHFKGFSVAHHTLSWDNGADFAPDFLHRLPPKRPCARPPKTVRRVIAHVGSRLNCQILSTFSAFKQTVSTNP